MTLLASTLVLALAWFATVNLFGSALAWLGAQRTLRSRQPSPALFLILRLLPAAAGVLFVVAVFLPGHLLFEPTESDESFGVVLSAFTMLGAVLVGRSASRLWTVARASAALRRWLGGRAHVVPGEVVEVRDLAGISLAGIFRTHILLGSSVRASLTPAELDVAVAHERAHRRSHDNLMCCLMFCAPDVLGWTRMAHELEARWRSEAECRADALAVAGDTARAIDLASALVKVARLAQQPTGRFASPVWSTFHEGAPLETRVHRLMSLPDAPSCESVLSGRVLAITLALPLVLWMSGVPYYLHRATEFLVAVLP